MEVAIGIAHAERKAFPAGTLLHADVRERRIPRDIDVTREKLINLPLVIREEREIERHALLLKIVANTLPDRDDLRVIRHCAEKNGFSHGHLRKGEVPSIRVQRIRGDDRLSAPSPI